MSFCLREMSAWIDMQRNDGKNVLVHCQAGVSRSALAVIAYLMDKYRLTYDAALR